MRIEYRVSYLDTLWFNVTHQLLSPLVSGFYIVLAFVIGVGQLRIGNTFVHSVGVAFTLYVIMWLAQSLFTAAWLFSRRDDPVRTEHVTEVGDDGLFDSTKFSKVHYFWPGVRKVVVRPGFIGIYVAKHLAFVIPKRAFGSEAARAEFLALVRAKKGESQVATLA